MICNLVGRMSDKYQENIQLFWRVYQEAVLCTLTKKNVLTENEYEACLELLFDQQSVTKTGRDS